MYLCYGLHTMLNVVADKDGVGAAVLIRSCAPVSGKFVAVSLDLLLKVLKDNNSSIWIVSCISCDIT